MKILEKNYTIDKTATGIFSTSPLRPDAFEMDDDAKIECIQHHFTAIMECLGLNMVDDSLKDTPLRVAKMYVKEIFSSQTSLPACFQTIHLKCLSGGLVANKNKLR